MTNLEKMMASRTELELKVLDFLRDTGEPIDLECYIDVNDYHVLREFAEDYAPDSDGISPYNSERDADLQLRINKFISIYENDKRGIDHSYSDFNLVIDLIGELGL